MRSREPDTATEERTVPRLKARYHETLRGQLQDELGLRQHHAGAAARQDRGQHGRRRRHRPGLPARGRQRDLTTITGQKPLVTRAKKSIAGFKLREGNAIGAKVTPAGRPHVGVHRSADLDRHPPHPGLPGPQPPVVRRHGNYTFGLTEQLVFPEIDYDSIDQPRGMDITIVTTASTDAQGRALLLAMGFPFRREGQGKPWRRKRSSTSSSASPSSRCGLHPVPPLRPPALGVPQVRPLPRLPARAGPRGRAARRDQGELVRGGDDT